MDKVALAIREACNEIERRGAAAWDADESWSVEDNPHSPLFTLVRAFGPCVYGNPAHRRLCWLSMFAARRALACWERSCDRPEPHRALECVRQWLLTGQIAANWRALSRPVEPSLHGRPAADGGWRDSSGAACAAAWAVQFMMSADPLHAAYAMSSARAAFEQSPLGPADQFPEWMLEVAIPVAFAQREMTAEEQEALRGYDATQLPYYRARTRLSDEDDTPGGEPADDR